MSVLLCIYLINDIFPFSAVDGFLLFNEVSLTQLLSLIKSFYAGSNVFLKQEKTQVCVIKTCIPL